MRKKKVYARRALPPCPDPDSYILIKVDEGYYWRRKRGTMKPVELNEKMREYADLQKTSSPAASRILKRLSAFMKDFNKGHTYHALAGKLLKGLRKNGILDFSEMQDFELNFNHPLDHLLLSHYTVEEKDGHLVATIQQHAGGIKKQNSLSTEYYFELIIAWGDATKDSGLQLRHTSSGLYSFADDNPPVCVLELPVPSSKQPWMALLKTGCLEGDEFAINPKHYAMKVVRVSLVTN